MTTKTTTRGQHKVAHVMASLLLATTALGAGVIVATPAMAQDTRTYDIQAGPLADVLNQYARQAGVELAYHAELTGSASSPGLKGSYGFAEGLSRILAGTGITYRQTGPRAFTLEPAPTADAGTVQLGPVRVEGQNGQGGETTLGGNLRGPSADPVAQRLNPATTIGSKVPVRSRELAQSVTVTTQDQIQQQNLLTLDEAMRYAPGINVLSSDNQRFQYYARGYPISTFQVDGSPVFNNPNMSGTASTAAPTLAMYDRIEIIHGSDGLFNGFGGPGGTINLVRKHGQSEFSVSALADAGTYNNYGGQLDVGGPLNSAGTIRARVVGSYQDQDLTQDTTWKKDRLAYGTIEADLTPTTLLRVGADYSTTQERSNWSGSFVRADGSTLPRSLFFGSPWNRQKFYTTEAFAELEQKLSADWALHLSADYTYNKYQVVQAQCFGIVSASNTCSFGTTNKGGSEHNQSYDVNVSGPFSLFGGTHRITVGAFYLRADIPGLTMFGPSTNRLNMQTVNVFDVDFPKPTWSGTVADNVPTQEYQTRYGTYGNIRISLAKGLTLIGGGNVLWYKDTVSQVGFGISSGSSLDFKAKVTPYAGVIYDISKNYSVYASYTSIFEPSAFHDIDLHTLPPIQGKQYEAGVKAEYFDGRLNASVAVFQSDSTNRPLLDPNDPSGTSYIAAGRARSRGVEAMVSGEIAAGWTVQGGYTYNDAKYLDTSQDSYSSAFNMIAPKHLFKLWTNYQLPGQLRQWQIGAGVNASSKTWNACAACTAGRLTQDAYFTADARVSYQATQHVSVGLNLTNMFDRHYYSSFSNIGSVFWGDPRKLLATVRVTY